MLDGATGAGCARAVREQRCGRADASGKVATVLAVHGVAVDDGVTEASQGSWSVAVAVLV